MVRINIATESHSPVFSYGLQMPSFREIDISVMTMKGGLIDSEYYVVDIYGIIILSFDFSEPEDQTSDYAMKKRSSFYLLILFIDILFRGIGN